MTAVKEIQQFVAADCSLSAQAFLKFESERSRGRVGVLRREQYASRWARREANV